jgi:hypothetical protein
MVYRMIVWKPAAFLSATLAEETCVHRANTLRGWHDSRQNRGAYKQKIVINRNHNPRRSHKIWQSFLADKHSVYLYTIFSLKLRSSFRKQYKLKSLIPKILPCSPLQGAWGILVGIFNPRTDFMQYSSSENSVPPHPNNDRISLNLLRFY